MNKKKYQIIIFVYQNLTKYLYKKFAIQYLEKNGEKIKFLNILKLVNKKVYYEYKNEKKLKSRIFKNIESYSELFNEIKQGKSRILFFNAAGNNNFAMLIINIYLKIKQAYGFKIISGGTLIEEKKLKVHEQLKKLRYFKFNSVLNFFKRKFVLFLNSFFQPKLKFQIVGSPKIFDPLCKISIKSHSYEYLGFLEKKKHNKKENYFLFIDQARDHTFDHKINFGKNVFINKENYYKSLSQLFSIIEKTHKTKVVIASHHRRLGKFPYLNKRKIIKNKTLELILKARGVITHDSLATRYAIFANKPIIFIFNNDLKNSRPEKTKTIKGISKILGSICLNLDLPKKKITKIIFSSKNLKIDKKKYENYIKRYLVFPDKIQKLNPYILLTKKYNQYVEQN